MNENNIDIEKLGDSFEKLAGEGKTPMFIAINNSLAGIIAVADTVKKVAKQLLKSFIKWELKLLC